VDTNSLNPIVINGFLGFCLGLVSCVPQPVIAESVKENQTPENLAQSLLISPKLSLQLKMFSSKSC
jgi:hypothetical protein